MYVKKTIITSISILINLRQTERRKSVILNITDTPVAMSVKSHLRNAKPVVIAISTNDALSGSAKNIGALLNLKHYYFVPFRQDNCQGKPTSMVADFWQIPETLAAALEYRQIEPMVI